MNDVRAVDWLPLEAAVERLSRDHEQAFLANVGPLALEAAALAKRSRERKAPAPSKRRRAVVPAPPIVPSSDLAAPQVEQGRPLLEHEAMNAPAPEIVAVEPLPSLENPDEATHRRPIGLVRKVRAWLRRAA
jgi:8-oxo-dGTP diphosphatase